MDVRWSLDDPWQLVVYGVEAPMDVLAELDVYGDGAVHSKFKPMEGECSENIRKLSLHIFSHNIMKHQIIL